MLELQLLNAVPWRSSSTNVLGTTTVLSIGAVLDFKAGHVEKLMEIRLIFLTDIS